MAKVQKRGTKCIDAIPDILARISEGASALSACKANSLSIGNFLDRVANDADLAEKYARARESGADAEAEDMADLERQVLAGSLDPQAFKAAMDARKWRLARKSPRKYGDRQTIEQTTEHKFSAMSDDQLKARIAELMDATGIANG